MPMFTAILFGLDETLHDRAASLRAFLADQHARHFGNQVSRDAFVATFLSLDAHGSLAKALLYPRLLQALELVGPGADALARDYDLHFCAHARPMPGLADILATLRARGFRLGIVSNGATAFQHRTIDALHLRDALDTILISEAEGLRKPDPRLFHLAAAQLEASPDQCLFVGDNPEADILGAIAAGMKAVWFRRGVPWPGDLAAQPATIAALTELLAWVPSPDR